MGSLQEQGNVAFRGKRWEEALSLYQQALEAAQAVDPKSEAVGSLYSNLSATRIHLHQYDRGERYGLGSWDISRQDFR